VLREAGILTVRQMLLGAAVLDAPTLLARGFLNQVHEAGDLPAATRRLAEHMVRLAPQAARLNKRTLRQLQRSAALPADSEVLQSAFDYAASAEHREGINAFLSKREAVF
jgi:enoyl-CoA hydratase/carnithine racemase